jgi:hypothetical protein
MSSLRTQQIYSVSDHVFTAEMAIVIENYRESCCSRAVPAMFFENLLRHCARLAQLD